MFNLQTLIGMKLIKVFQVLFLLIVILECITGQNTPLVCSSIDSYCRLDAANLDSNNLQIKLTIKTPTSNSWYAIGFNSARKMIGTSTIMIEYTNGNYNAYTGYVSTYSAPSKDSTTYLKNLVTVTSGSSVTISFDAPTKITHNNNVLLDLNNCYYIAIGTGKISGTSLSMHASTPLFSSTCYKLSLPATSGTQTQSSASTITQALVTTAKGATTLTTKSSTATTKPTTKSRATTKRKGAKFSDESEEKISNSKKH